MAAGMTAGPVRAVAGVGVTVAAAFILVLAFRGTVGGGGGGRPGGAGLASGPRATSAATAGTTARSTATRPAEVAGTPAPGASGAAGSPSPTRVARPPAHADPLAGAAAGYAAARSGTVLAAVYDVRTGQTWRLGDGGPQAEASIVKLDILQTLLAGQPAGLSPANQALALQMIENSDNNAATSLWYAAGGTSGLAAYNQRAGLTRTTPSACVQCTGFPWPGWGLTTTVPADQLVLLKHLIRPSALLTPADRRYILSLMENVTPDQRWGVSGGVPAGVTVALKNGWLPLNAADTDWQINSVGWVHGAGRNYLIAVLTTGNPTEQYGIDTIDQLSALVWSAMS